MGLWVQSILLSPFNIHISPQQTLLIRDTIEEGTQSLYQYNPPPSPTPHQSYMVSVFFLSFASTLFCCLLDHLSFSLSDANIHALLLFLGTYPQFKSSCTYLGKKNQEISTSRIVRMRHRDHEQSFALLLFFWLRTKLCFIRIFSHLLVHGVYIN